MSKLLLLIISSTLILAQEFDNISFHGFGTFGGVYQENKNIIYRSSFNTEKGSKGNISLENETKLGLQLDANIYKNIDLTFQAVANENHGNSQLIRVELADIKYQPFDFLNIRAGIMQIPTFMYSDTLNISYTYNWVRLPNMYELVPFSNYNGIELNYLYDLDESFIHLKLFYGNEKDSIKTVCCSKNIEKSDLEIDNLFGIALTFNTTNLKIRASYTTFDFTINNKRMDSLAVLLQNYNIDNINKAIEHYNIKKTPSRYFNIGINYNINNAFIIAEYINFDTDSFQADMQSWYGSIGYNFDNFIPYLTYARTISNSNYKKIPLDEQNIQLSFLIQSINTQFIDIAEGTGITQDTFSLGTRYDILDNVALKVQYDYLKEHKVSIPMHFNNEKSTTLHIFSATVDFVF